MDTHVAVVVYQQLCGRGVMSARDSERFVNENVS